jgi:hypothetical protein
MLSCRRILCLAVAAMGPLCLSQPGLAQERAPLRFVLDGGAVAQREDAVTLAARYSFDLASVQSSVPVRDGPLARGAADVRGLKTGALTRLWPGGRAAGAGAKALEINGTAFGVKSGAITISRRVGDTLKLAVTGRWLNMKQVLDPDPEEQNDLHLTAFWDLDRNTTVQAEFLSGTGIESDGTSHDTDRIWLALRYDF